MSEAVRLYRYRTLLSGNRCVPKDRLIAEVEVSEATFKRDIAKLRDQFGVPIVFDRDRGGYVIDTNTDVQELPGVWFTQQELLALATIQQMMEQLEPTLLGPQLEPLGMKLDQIMRQQGFEAADMSRRIKLLHAGKRPIDANIFSVVSRATFERHQIALTHFNRSSSKTIQRTVSPIEIVLYRGNWYLNAWCHLREDLRRFSIDAISTAESKSEAAIEISEEEVATKLGQGYGIFSGTNVDTAVLQFSKERAEWVQNEVWHPDQVGVLKPNGAYTLEVPYADERELIADLLKYGHTVEVIRPASLRSSMKRALEAALGLYT
jgi:predicted DNA-binding transcriptional regulator YafY